MIKTFEQWWSEAKNHPVYRWEDNELRKVLLEQFAFDAWSAAINSIGYLPYEKKKK